MLRESDVLNAAGVHSVDEFFIRNINATYHQGKDGWYHPALAFEAGLFEQEDGPSPRLKNKGNTFLVSLAYRAESGVITHGQNVQMPIDFEEVKRVRVNLIPSKTPDGFKNWQITSLGINNTRFKINPIQLHFTPPESDLAKVVLGEDAYHQGSDANRRLLRFRRAAALASKIPGVNQILTWGYINLDETIAGYAREIGLHEASKAIYRLSSRIIRRGYLRNTRRRLRGMTSSLKQEFGLGD